MLRHPRGVIAIVALCLASCASSPLVPPVGRAAVAGTLQLVPPRGAADHGGHGAAYGDRRLQGARRFDYSTPGFAVVYLEGGGRPGGRVDLAVESTRTGTRLAPDIAAVGASGEIGLANRTGREAVISIPELGRVARLDPGSEVVVRIERAGPVELFLLGSQEGALVWASPGPFARPDAAGRFALDDLAPGAATVRAWHPRLPPASVRVELVANQVTSVDFTLGAGQRNPHDAEGGQGNAHDAR